MRISAFWAAICWWTLSGPVSAQPERFEFERGLMGTEFRIVLYAEDSVRAALAAGRAFGRVDSLNLILSDYLPESELNLAAARSGSGELIPVSDDLWNVLTYAQRVARQSGGAFDVTVGPLTRLWRRAIRRGEPPDSADIGQALKSVGYELLRLDSTFIAPPRAIRLPAPGMRLDLGGIAKGYAVDEAFRLLVEAGYRRILVDGGGDMRLGDPPPDKPGWVIVISGRGDTGARYEQTEAASNTAIAQSGATYRYVEEGGIRYSHIVDPRTGYGVTADRLVTVFAPSCMEADALASAFSVVQVGERRALRELHPNARVKIDEP